ncbi:MAG: ABC transporter permease [Confluentimicrobium sp.]|mgnify:CR=1 FL=1|jgi:peptide/nickel transport system permease protein|uniref:Peptide/nickel transport system permease protein n=1 Tax=Actibacterium naphthalenivorans TaxID=1614693 RepID=A0A840C969_9RHOB|nr:MULTISPECIES: ABC transporter permease [Actibacterium]KGB80431.1 ABC transporter permease [Rhodovulum sp. NI22]MDY6859177.1 ABC transporter permease [Pseudomonadota bacterium]ALG89040.1 ABC transporter permease [Actibacterium sp. EMB200-NS6]MBB4021403.1 peptide/nickel transport system permease protein [Actibacterium naphthalenivorans]MBC56862.1 ABC transporter permease [Actibacterium sp.]|tara:strand:+ start:83 stop:1015 length:933 start_codon:yes stop_codon:yes gene_type:complete
MRWVTIKSLRAVLTMWLVVTFVFFVLRLSGDPTDVLLPDDIDQATRDFYRTLWGLDAPLWDQYVSYLRGLAHGDFGISFRNNQDAFQLVRDRVPKTALLGGTAIAIALLLGVPLGVLAALYRDSWLDRTVMGLAVFGFSMPNFFLGILLILIFSLQLRWLPSSGSGTWWHLIMPALTLGTGFAAQIARYTRSSMIDVLSKPYMRTARSKGAGPARRVGLHALPNASVPVVTILGLKVGEMLGWAVVTETVFAWPGIGRLLTNAVATRDLAVVQCIMIVLAFTMVSANVIVDLVYGWLDPRVRVGAGARQR